MSGSRDYAPLPSTCPDEEAPALPPSTLTHNSLSNNSTILAFFILGLGTLLPWSAFLATLDFYTILLPSISITQFITNCYTVPFMIFGIWIAITSSPPPRRLSIGGGFLIVTILSFLLPSTVRTTQSIQDPFISPVFWLTIISAVLIGMSNAIIQSTLFATLTLFPDARCTTAFSGGAGVAAILISILRILCRLVLDSSESTSIEGLHDGFEVFFYTCTLLCATCLVAYAWLELGCFEYKLRITEGDAVNEKGEGGMSSLYQTVAEMKWPGIAVFLSMAITLASFPGLTVQIPINLRNVVSDRLASWFPLIVITIMAVGDTIGRSAVGERTMRRWKEWLSWLLFGRVVSLPLIIGVWGFGIASWDGAWLLLLISGVMNGAIITLCFLSVNKVVAEERRELAGRLMFVGLIVGMASGTMLGWILENILKCVTEF